MGDVFDKVKSLKHKEAPLRITGLLPKLTAYEKTIIVVYINQVKRF